MPLHADRLVERLAEVTRPFATVLDLGCRDGHLARALARRPGVERVVHTGDITQARTLEVLSRLERPVDLEPLGARTLVLGEERPEGREEPLVVRPTSRHVFTFVTQRPFVPDGKDGIA